MLDQLLSLSTRYAQASNHSKFGQVYVTIGLVFTSVI